MLTRQLIKKHLNNLNIHQTQSIRNELEFEIWKPTEIDELNDAYEVDKLLSGYFGIGSSGGGEMLAIELETGIIWSIPFIPMDSSERIKVANNLDDLNIN